MQFKIDASQFRSHRTPRPSVIIPITSINNSSRMKPIHDNASPTNAFTSRGPAIPDAQAH
jgi:hypothetical protein